KAIYRFAQRDRDGALQFLFTPSAGGVKVRFEYVVFPVSTRVGNAFPQEIQLNVTVKTQPSGLEQSMRTGKIRPVRDQPPALVNSGHLLYRGGFELDRPEQFLPFISPLTGQLVEPLDMGIEIVCATNNVFLAVTDQEQHGGLADVGLINVDGR